MPINFELAVGIFVIILVWTPTHLFQRRTNFRDDIVSTHKCGLVVTRFFLNITFIGNGGTIFIDEMELRFDAGFQ